MMISIVHAALYTDRVLSTNQLYTRMYIL